MAINFVSSFFYDIGIGTTYMKYLRTVTMSISTSMMVLFAACIILLAILDCDLCAFAALLAVSFGFLGIRDLPNWDII